jgi:hypothetical protein
MPRTSEDLSSYVEVGPPPEGQLRRVELVFIFSIIPAWMVSYTHGTIVAILIMVFLLLLGSLVQSVWERAYVESQ